MGNKFCWTSYFGHISCAHKFIHSVPPVHSIIILSSSASKSFSLVLSLIYTTLRHLEITIQDNISSRKIPAIWIVSEVLWKLPLWKVSLCHVRCEGIHEDNWGQSWPVIQLSKDLIPKWYSWTSRSIDLKKKTAINTCMRQDCPQIKHRILECLGRNLSCGFSLNDSKWSIQDLRYQNDWNSDYRGQLRIKFLWWPVFAIEAKSLDRTFKNCEEVSQRNHRKENW